MNSSSHLSSNSRESNTTDLSFLKKHNFPKLHQTFSFVWVWSAWFSRPGVPELSWSHSDLDHWLLDSFPRASRSGVRLGKAVLYHQVVFMGRRLRKFGSHWFDGSWILPSQNKLVPPKCPPSFFRGCLLRRIVSGQCKTLQYIPNSFPLS